MPSHDFDPMTDPAFQGWALRVADELWLELGEPGPTNTVLNWLWTMFTNNGEMPPHRLAEDVQRRRATLTKHRMRSLLDQARQETGLDIAESFLVTAPDAHEPTGQVYVGNTVIRSFRESWIAKETADAVQDHLMSRYRTVWPVCPRHHLGVHVIRTSTGPAWECSTGPHRFPIYDNPPQAKD
ncbi:hypothetical protein [Streptomyces sp. NPDC059816]|uniref:hypothetical protein n=1 Tax=Streptomyces sp. NPDC059816 TaxID=3346960 RepID=UPI00365926A9